MYTREQFLKAVSSEIRIIKHLATKIPTGKEGYRPSESQRSTLELLQYLSATGAITMKVMLNENVKSYEDYVSFRDDVSVENFALKMDIQEKDIRDMFEKITDEDLKKEFDYYGSRTKAEHLISGILQTFAAYRMQLFLYVKACGANVSTMDVWAGMDTPNKN
ncbi:MAG: hypothetical protein ACYCZW_01505 [Minisyncoccota bacterium]